MLPLGGSEEVQWLERSRMCVLRAPAGSCGSQFGSENVQRAWAAVKILVPFWFNNTIRHLVFRGQKGTIILTTTHMLAVLTSYTAEIHAGGFRSP